MPISTVDGIIAGGQYPRGFEKVLSGALVAGRPFSSWGLNGAPGPGSYNNTLNGVNLSNTDAGCIPFTNPGSGNSYLSRLLGQATIGGQLILCDRLWHNGGFTITSTSAQTITQPTLPARDANGSTNGVGVNLGMEISAATGAGTPTITASYTNSAGTGSRSATNIDATVATSAARTFYRIGLQAGDDGVRSVASITLSATWTSGTMNLVAYRKVATLDLAGDLIPNAGDSLTLGFPPIYNSSCLFFLFVPRTTTSTMIQGSLNWTQG